MDEAAFYEDVGVSTWLTLNSPYGDTKIKHANDNFKAALRSFIWEYWCRHTAIDDDRRPHRAAMRKSSPRMHRE